MKKFGKNIILEMQIFINHTLSNDKLNDILSTIIEIDQKNHIVDQKNHIKFHHLQIHIANRDQISQCTD